MNYTLTHRSWNWKEKLAIINTIRRGRYTMGPKVMEFENMFAKYVGAEHAIMTNSGSSANMVALASIFYNNAYDLEPGDEVIVPAISWSTTYFPIIQLGLVPVFVDVSMESFNIDVRKVRAAITPRTRMIFAVNLLGLPADLISLQEICKARNIILLEDNCESLGSTINNKQTGTFGLAGTYSFFFSHHLQTMEGGMIVTNDGILADYMRSLRAHGWVRDLRTDHLYKKTGDVFEDSFKFILPGYCMRPLEMSGAIGIEQLKKLDYFIERRRRNAGIFKLHFGADCIIQKEPAHVKSSWFGFGIVLEDEKFESRKRVIDRLTRAGVETRPIVTGNFLTQPVMKLMPQSRVGSTMEVAEYIDKNGFFIGNDSRNLKSQIKYASDIIEDECYPSPEMIISKRIVRLDYHPDYPIED